MCVCVCGGYRWVVELDNEVFVPIFVFRTLIRKLKLRNNYLCVTNAS